VKLRVFIILILVFSLINYYSFAGQSQVDASDVFSSGSASLYATKTAGLFATTQYSVSSIKADYCILYKQVGSSWVYVYTINPSDECSGCQFEAYVDFSAYISTGTYRVKVCFRANGHTIIRFSNPRTF